MKRTRTKGTYVRLTEKERTVLETVAESWGTTMSDVLRWALRQVVAGKKARARGEKNKPSTA